MKYLFIGLYILCSLFVSCKQKPQQTVLLANNNTGITEIELGNSEICSELCYSALFKEPKTIILETNKNCLIKRIHGVELFNDNLYIHDDKMKRLFVFGMDGAFKYEIGKPGIGPGEYIELSDFSIDREQHVIYLWDEARKMALKYDLNNNKFISSTHIPEIKGQCYSFLYKNEKFYINSTSIENDESEKYLLNEIDSHTGEIIHKYLPAEKYNKGWNIPLRLSHSNFYSKNSNKPKFIEMFSDTIVSITDEGIMSSYVITSELTIPKHELDKINDNYHKKNRLIDLNTLYVNDYIYQVCNFMEFNHFIYFQYTKGIQIQHVFFNKENKKLQTSQILKNDYISSNTYIHTNMMFHDENGILTVLRTEELPRLINAISNNKVNKELNNYDQLINIEEESNPILFYHEFK